MAQSHATHASRPNPIRRLYALIVAAAMLITLPAGAMTAVAADPISGVGEVSGSHLKLTLTRTDELGDSPAVGSRLTYTLKYENLTSSQFTAYPTASTLTNVAENQATNKPYPICRYTLGAKATGECKTNGTNNFATHVVTEADKTNGFTPSATVVATTNANNATGDNVLETLTVTGDTIYKPAETNKNTHLKLTLERTDSLGDSVSVGARLTYKVKYENLTDSAFTAYPKSSNLSGVVPACRWRNLGAKATQECSGDGKAYHDVTETDKANGGFTPTVTFVASTDDDGTQVLETVTATAPKVTVTTPDPDAKYISVTTERVDTLGENLEVGQKVRYKFDYKKLTDRDVTVFPKESNLTNTDVTAQNNCRITSFGSSDTFSCNNENLGYHVITAEDVIAGSFTPTTLFQATTDRNGGTVLQDNIVVTGTPVTIKTPAKDAASTPTERKDGETVELAAARKFGSESYRIPALAEGKNGRILAAWDLRPLAGDAPQPNSIVQRYSDDGGKSWSDIKYVAQGRNATNKYGYSDPSYVVDRETGTIFLFFVKSYDAGFAASQLGTDPAARGVLQAAVTKSTDNGETWSEPKIITDQVTKGHENAWRSRFATSGAGIQLKYGTHKGRLIQQFAVAPVSGNNYAVSIYSDDHGESWKVGGVISSTNMDENKVVELSDGSVMVNARPGAGKSFRKVAISKDGGETYGDVKIETQLPDPNNNGHITRAYPNAPEGSAKAKILLYSAPNNNKSRDNGTVRISFDDGQTWSGTVATGADGYSTVDTKLFKSGNTGYSVIVALSDEAGGGYGLFYESDWQNNGVDSYHMVYTRLSLDWLGYMTATANGSGTVKQGVTTTTVPVSVTNDGQTDYTEATVTPTGLPEGWSAQPATVGALAKGETKTVNVTVTVPETAKSGDVATATLKLTGKYAQSTDTLKSFDEGKLTVTVTDPDPTPEPTITGITAATSQKEYTVGDTFKPETVTVAAAMSDGTSQALGSDEYTLSAKDAAGNTVDLTKAFAAAGTVTVTATLKADTALAASFTVTVNEKSEPEPEVTIKSIAASTSQTEFTVGDTFKPEAVTVTATMSDGTTKALTADEYALSAKDAAGTVVDLTKPFAAAGTVTVTATLKADAALAASFTVTVNEKSEPGPGPQPTVTIKSIVATTTQTKAKVGDKFDAGAVTVVANLSDGTTRTLKAGEYTLSAKDAAGNVVDLTKPFAAAGTVTVTATLANVKAALSSSFSIAVSAKDTPESPKPAPTPTTPKPTPGLSKTGASVAGVAAAFALLAVAGGAVVALRRRRA
ncbi:exo-alpha-sialidase [Bifidobacterium leontopitheci]|uniref:exo-alpha-sialidase n=1 Tax=Bifidobacterium leontopitheci TaxID=2650774 RepID=A0A6I1GG82_9BIFI|nr:exo-alpha-sialidase [Bifidobacterium leontopitheci]KAB7788696.1 sialidase [Bifidobacterium leontopitheci]